MKSRELPNVIEQPWERQQLFVPRDDAAVFSSPPYREVLALSADNRAQLEACESNVQGRSLPRLREWTRREAVLAAREYTSALIGEDAGGAPAGLLFAAGHQPSLFHPGVWIKNYALGRLAAGGNGLGLNLVVDNDVLSETSIRVPRGNRHQPRIERIPFDAHQPAIPWEDASVKNRETFETFGERVAEAMADWNVAPLARDLWPVAVDHLQASGLLRDCLTAARNTMERRWGISNLELPLSRLCTLDPFLWFASHLLAQLPRFRETYNTVLEEYRGINRVRSKNHPVPRLEREGDWYEAPFWVWRKGDLRRLPVFARQAGREVLLSDGRQEFARLPLSPEMDACCAVEVLRALPQQGIRFRTRALTTTMFARLCLSDMFLHGIGGAKYDEMTDHIIARFFRTEPPRFGTLSATLLLPIARPYPVTRDDESRLRHLLRDVDYNPDRHISDGAAPDVATLLDRKQHLVAEQQAAASRQLSKADRRQRRRENYQRFRGFRDVAGRLAPFTSDSGREVERELADVRRQLEANEILAARDYSFSLYPADRLKRFMTSVWTD